MIRQNGFALISAVFIVLVMGLIVLATSTMISTEAVVATKNYRSLDAFYIAAAGLEFYTKELDGDIDWTSPPENKSRAFSGGYFYVVTSDEAQHSIKLIVTGLLTAEGQTFVRTLQVEMSRTISGGGGYASFGVYCVGGSGTLNITDNVTINGDLYVENDINVGNNVTINGDLRSAGNITGDTSGVTGDIEPYADPPADPPDLDTSYYEGEISYAQSSGSPPPGSWPDPISGTYYINGWANITGRTVYDNTTIVASDGMNLNGLIIGDNCMIISGGQISFSGTSESEAAEIGKNTTVYATTDFWLQNYVNGGANEEGGGCVLLSAGNMWVNSTGTYYGYLHAISELQVMNSTSITGNLIGGDFGQLSNWCTITFDPDVNNYDDIEGINVSGGTSSCEVNDWEEIY